MADEPARATVVAPAGRADRDALRAVYGRAFDDPFPKTAFDGLAATPGAFVLAARPPGAPGPERLGGFAVARAIADEGEILTVGVDPPLRRSGLGRALIAATLAHLGARGARAVFLEVAMDNRAARALYRTSGFVEVGRRPGYYRRAHGEVMDALLLRYDTVE